MKSVDQKTLPVQVFNGLEYRLYPREKYFSRGRRRLHIVAWEYFNNQKVTKGFHVHHDNGNTFDNSKENLLLKEGKKHISEHGLKRHKENPEWFKQFAAMGQDAAKEWHGSEEGLEWHRNHWANSIGKSMIEKEKICQHCGKIYITKKVTRSKFCHQNCKAKQFRLRHKTL